MPCTHYLAPHEHLALSVGSTGLASILLLSFIHELLFINVLLLLEFLLCFESPGGRLILAIASRGVADIGLAVDAIQRSARVAILAHCKVLRVDSTCTIDWMTLAHVDTSTIPLP